MIASTDKSSVEKEHFHSSTRTCLWFHRLPETYIHNNINKRDTPNLLNVSVSYFSLLHSSDSSEDYSINKDLCSKIGLGLSSAMTCFRQLILSQYAWYNWYRVIVELWYKKDFQDLGKEYGVIDLEPVYLLFTHVTPLLDLLVNIPMIGYIY